MSHEQITSAARWDRLSVLHRTAVCLGWRGWVSAPETLMAVWAEVPDLDERPASVAAIDWCRLTDAAAASSERRARWVWHDIASEAIMMIPDSSARRQCAIQAADALNFLTDADACLASAAACRSAVKLIGAPAARRAVEMAYSGCRPELAVVVNCIASVRHVEIGGRVYVIG